MIAQDAGLDDRILEILKVLLVYEHPVLLRRSRLRLTLDSISKTNLEFAVAYEHDSHRYRASLPIHAAKAAVASPKAIKNWIKSAHREDLFNLPDHWVNVWRWSPQPTALDRLKSYAKEARDAKPIDTTSTAFQQMLAGIPRGSHLPSWAKKDLRDLFNYAKASNLQALEDQLFEIRFGVELENDWSTNTDTTDIDTLWQLLKDLPDTNVEGNTKLREILLDAGQGGGTYDPSTHDIAIGSQELSQNERFEDVVRHEVGHAVHENQDALVSPWLETKFGWRMLGNTNADIEQWVQLMGGWGNITNQEIAEIRTALRAALGPGGKWKPGPKPNFPAAHPWNRPNFAPRIAFENSGPDWYLNFKTWHRHQGVAFCCNFWYQTLMTVNESTLDLVAKMPDSYAAMSPAEFFAELYALYYDLNDPQRSVIPKPITAWFRKNIGAPEPAAPSRKQQPWDSTRRPRKKK